MISQMLDKQKAEWIRKNRGLVQRVADEFGLSHAMARRVFWEEAASREKRVEARFIELGAPGFKALLEKAS